ncbi:unnamed protein product [Laminaria digitata]
MMNRGVLRVSAFAQARKIGAAALGVRSSGGGIGGGGGATTADVGMKAWLSATPGSGESSNDNDDDPTPAETKLAFSSTVYGKDPASAADLTPAEVAAAAHLKQAAAAAAAAAAASGKPSAATSRGHDARAMFDSSLSQQAEDGKSSGDIKRDVAADTPDATRVAFRASAYGKDPQMAAELSEAEAAELGALRARARGGSSGGAAPVHDDRNMFDSDLVHGAGGARASGDIKRDVTAGTPDATRVAFRASAYGKDPQMAAELSEAEAAEVGALRARARGGSSGGAAPVHDDRNMFDSDLVHGAGGARASGDIKRDVTADTPDATRVAFRASAYGKDPQGAAAHSAQEAAEVETMRKVAERSAGAGATAPVHDERSMFDSDLTHGAGSARGSEAIKREVAADTPEATRLVFGGSDYGKDQESMARSAREQVEMDALAARSAKKEAAATAAAGAGGAAPIHDDRSMFDSELTQGAGVVRDSGAIKRERDVQTETPALTRLSFFGSTYGDDDPGDESAEGAEELATKQAKGEKLATVGRGARKSKVHDTKKAMADDEYSQAGSE